MKSFKQFITKQDLNESSYKEVQKWVFDKLENSDMDSEEMMKQFIKKFGQGAVKHYEKALSEYMD